MRAYLIAGEASGDKLGGALMAGLDEFESNLTYGGIGGPQMQAKGLISLFAYSELSVMGLVEVLPKYRHFKRRIAQVAQDVIKAKPDVLITIDSPDFCLRVAKLVKASSNIRTVHYVAPSVWAWRAGRAKKMAAYIDQVLALLPFEPPYMQAAGMRCDFVGHPVVAEPQIDAQKLGKFRHLHGIGDAPMLLVLPGSRNSEAARLLPVFGKAMQLVHAKHPDTKIVVPAASQVAGTVLDFTRQWPGNPIILDPRDHTVDQAEEIKRTAFKAADAALAASGTVTLELAAAATPMVVAYDMKWLSWQIMNYMAYVDTVTLVNLVTDTRVIPEFLGPECQPGAIAKALNELLHDPMAGEAQVDGMLQTMSALGFGAMAPGHRAAQAVLDGLAER